MSRAKRRARWSDMSGGMELSGESARLAAIGAVELAPGAAIAIVDGVTKIRRVRWWVW